MDRRAWQASVHRVTESRTQLKQLSTFIIQYIYGQIYFLSYVVKKILGFPGGSVVKNLLASVGDMGLIPGLGRSPAEGNDNTLQYSCLKNPVDRGAWWGGL